jgi:hypothetical protein
LQYVIALFGTLISLPLVAIATFWLYAHFIENPRFARLSFENTLEIDKVLASRRWHWGAHPWGSFYSGCAYAIVSLPDTAPIVPPQSWSVPWTQTPVRISNGRHDALEECLYLWSDDLGHRLIRIHDSPGAHYAIQRP